MGCINDVWLPLFHSQAEAYAAARHRAGAGVIIQSSYPETAEIVCVRCPASGKCGFYRTGDVLKYAEWQVMKRTANGRLVKKKIIIPSSFSGCFASKVVHFNDRTCGHIWLGLKWISCVDWRSTWCLSDESPVEGARILFWFSCFPKERQTDINCDVIGMMSDLHHLFSVSLLYEF